MNRELKTELGVCKIGNHFTVTSISTGIIMHVSAALIESPYSSKSFYARPVSHSCVVLLWCRTVLLLFFCIHTIIHHINQL